MNRRRGRVQFEPIRFIGTRAGLLRPTRVEGTTAGRSDHPLTPRFIGFKIPYAKTVTIGRDRMVHVRHAPPTWPADAGVGWSYPPGLMGTRCCVLRITIGVLKISLGMTSLWNLPQISEQRWGGLEGSHCAWGD